MDRYYRIVVPVDKTCDYYIEECEENPEIPYGIEIGFRKDFKGLIAPGNFIYIYRVEDDYVGMTYEQVKTIEPFITEKWKDETFNFINTF